MNFLTNKDNIRYALIVIFFLVWLIIGYLFGKIKGENAGFKKILTSGVLLMIMLIILYLTEGDKYGGSLSFGVFGSLILFVFCCIGYSLNYMPYYTTTAFTTLSLLIFISVTRSGGHLHGLYYIA